MGFVEQVTQPTGLRRWTGSIPLEYRYTAGVAGERFFQALRERGELLGTRCARCRRTYLPPRMYCSTCFAHLEEYVPVGPQGRIHSVTRVHRGVDGAPLSRPRTVALIRFPDVTGGLIHLVDEDGGRVKVGAAVAPVLRPPAERRGLITDIQHFRIVVKG